MTVRPRVQASACPMVFSSFGLVIDLDFVRLLGSDCPNGWLGVRRCMHCKLSMMLRLDDAIEPCYVKVMVWRSEDSAVSFRISGTLQPSYSQTSLRSSLGGGGGREDGIMREWHNRYSVG